MRKLFHTVAALSALVATSMAANAADVTARPYSPPPYVPPAYVAPVFTWTGFYLGGNIGGAWRNDNLSDTLSGLNFSTETTTAYSSEEANSGSTGKSATSFSDLNGTSTGLRTTITLVPYLFRRLELSR